MTLAAVRERLHEYIDHADGKQVQAMFSFMENQTGDEDVIFDKETIAVLNERHNNYLSGKSKAHTLQESMEYTRKHRAGK